MIFQMLALNIEKLNIDYIDFQNNVHQINIDIQSDYELLINYCKRI